MNPSQISIDPEGNILMAPAILVAVHATTVWFRTGQGGATAAAGSGPLQGPAGSGMSFEGGSGRNIKVTTNGAADLQAHRWFTPSAPDLWASAFNGLLTVTRDPGTGALSLGDGVDVIAEAAGGFTSGSAPTGVASGGTFPVLNWSLLAEDGTYASWNGVEAPTAALYLDKITGDALITYGSLVSHAERLGGSTTTPAGVYTATATGETDWNSGNPWTYTVTAPVGSSAALVSTAYGETTYNAGNPFTIDIEREAGTDWTARPAVVSLPGTTAQQGYFTPTGWGAFQSVDDAAWTIALDGTTGAGELHDGNDVVATRGEGSPYDPSGQWESTTYGATAYGPFFDAFTGTVGLGRAVTLQGVVYVTAGRETGTGEATGLTGPFWTAGALPGNTSTEVHFPVAEIDAQGVPQQIQFGPIPWWALP